MVIDISDEKIEEMIKEQVDTSVRKRIKEMQGNYTSKSFIEDIVQKVVWNNIIELCPDINDYIQDEIKRCVDCAFEYKPKLTKKQLVENVVEELLEKLNS